MDERSCNDSKEVENPVKLDQSDIVKNLFHPSYQDAAEESDKIHHGLEHGIEHDHERDREREHVKNTSMNADTGAALFRYDCQHSKELQMDTDMQPRQNSTEVNESLSSMAVHTGHTTRTKPSNHNRNHLHSDNHHPTRENRNSSPGAKEIFNPEDLGTMGLVTPQKHLQSPPFVKRKIPIAIETDAHTNQGMHLFQNSHACSPNGNTNANANANIKSKASSFEIHTRNDYARGARAITRRELEEEEGETSSLVSEYGSEVGEVNLRLEDVHAMEALAEGGSEGDDDDDDEAEAEPNDTDDDNGEDGCVLDDQEDNFAQFNNEDKDRRSERGVDSGISYESLKDKLNEASDGMHSNINRRNHDHCHDEDNEDLSQDGDGSIDSVDLSSHYGPAPSESQGEGTSRPSDILPEQTARVPAPLHTQNKPVSPSHMMHHNHQKEDNEPPTTPIGAVSAALRRFGNGVSNMTRCTKTPPRLSPYHCVVEKGMTPQQQRLDDDNVWLSPRFGNAKNYVPQTSIQQPMFRSAPVGRKGGNGIGNGTISGNAASKAAVKGITSCLSFDPESGRRPYRNMRISDSPPSSPLPTHRKTRSWGSAGSDFFEGNVKDLLDSSKGGKSMQHLGQGPSFIPNRDGMAGMSPRGHIRFVDGPMYSPKASTNARHIVLLQSPQRVGDIEREDALDLLALLVERSVAFKEKMDMPSVGDTQGKIGDCNGNDEAPSLNLKGCIDALRQISKDCNSRSNEEVSPSHEDRMAVLDQLDHSHTYAMEMKQAALSASTWLTAIGRTGTGTGETPRQAEHRYSKGSQFISEEKMLQMDSHELRRLVQAAHAQLVTKNEISDRLDNELSICRAEIGRLKTISSRNETSFLSPDKSILDEEVDDDSSDSSRGSSKNEFPDGCDFNIEMNGNASEAEDQNNNVATSAGSIADARKEILFLKAELEETNRMLRSMEQGIKWPNTEYPKVIKKTNSDISKTQDEVSMENVDSEVVSGVPVVPAFSDDSDGSSQKAANDEIEMKSSEPINSQTAVDQNTSIMMDGLRDELEAYVSAVRKSDEHEISNLQRKVNELEMARVSSTNPDDKMINVRMLNAENFVTEWDKLGPLPPPPDHDLRSPIVSDLLTQWTSDPETQESFLVWVEKVAQGSDCADIPPLQLSGLDHQVRDGFTMHILPFLLRRSDIQVDVTSRAHRKTSYDLSVTICEAPSTQGGAITFGENRQNNPNAISEVNLKSNMMAFKASSTNAPLDYSLDIVEPLEKKGFRRYLPSSLETGSVTNSSATTPASNRVVYQTQLNRLVRNEEKLVTRARDNEPDECTTSAESMDRIPQHQGGLMAGALNAMGGLLSRRKTPCSTDSSSIKMFSSPSPSLQSHSSQALNDSNTSDTQEESQPFHRVVSVPPGRIGMTFVQYRGHAMVSDVYKDSPLAGWVFPSDILIAIDEVPVSGLRVPEIVKLLTARKERQRALRIISSHAMTELLITESSNALMDG